LPSSSSSSPQPSSWNMSSIPSPSFQPRAISTRTARIPTTPRRLVAGSRRTQWSTMLLARTHRYLRFEKIVAVQKFPTKIRQYLLPPRTLRVQDSGDPDRPRQKTDQDGHNPRNPAPDRWQLVVAPSHQFQDPWLRPAPRETHRADRQIERRYEPYHGRAPRDLVAGMETSHVRRACSRVYSSCASTECAAVISCTRWQPGAYHFAVAGIRIGACVRGLHSLCR